MNIEEVTHDQAVEALKSAGNNVTLVIAQNPPELADPPGKLLQSLLHP